MLVTCAHKVLEAAVIATLTSHIAATHVFVGGLVGGDQVGVEARQAQDGPDREETYHRLDHARWRLLHRVQKLTIVFGHCEHAGDGGD